MTHIEIKTLEDLKSLNLQSLTVIEDVSIDIKLRLENEDLEYPINIFHDTAGFTSKINIKLALFGKSKVKMPVEIHVKEGAKDTTTNFKALVYIMSGSAHANITPGLFIHEKDILGASHGVIIKNVKDRDLVYLQSRGIEKSEAKEIIVGL
jgi:Fe-S cluster assembly scaffold protein SufB